MVLLHALVRLGPRFDLHLHVAHIHHGLRGRSADLDAALVAAEAARHGLSVSVERLTAATRPRGVSVQVWARESRYASLDTIRKRVRAAWIVTAHTRNDQAETILLNILRGTGPRGLAGIPGVRNRILRPLLGVSRLEIEAYAGRHGVPFREDPSNTSVAYRRNRIRHQLLPAPGAPVQPADRGDPRRSGVPGAGGRRGTDGAGRIAGRRGHPRAGSDDRGERFRLAGSPGGGGASAAAHGVSSGGRGAAWAHASPLGGTDGVGGGRRDGSSAGRAAGLGQGENPLGGAEQRAGVLSRGRATCGPRRRHLSSPEGGHGGSPAGATSG